MPFGLFKKKKEVLDLSGTSSSGIPVPKRLQSSSPASNAAQPSAESLIGGTLDLTSSQNSSSISAPAVNESSSSSGGGFFGFFGGSDSSSTNSTSSSPAASASPSPSPYSSSSSASSAYPEFNSSQSLSSIGIQQMQDKLREVSERVSRLVDRIELLELKINKFERQSY